MHALDRPVTALMRSVAAEIILPRFRMLRSEDISEKTPGDLVTIVDHESEARLTEALGALLPDARVIGEEAVEADPMLTARIGEGLLWLVDPLDGTVNFAEGKPIFAVMIALVADGVQQAGWILDAVNGRMCHAVLGGGAFIDGQRIWAQGTGHAQPVGGIATYFMTPEREADVRQRAAGRMTIADIPRCAGEQYPRIVCGRNDFALFERTMPWDHAPGALFLNEAGGRVARADGRDYRVDDSGRGMIAAASPALWDEAARIIWG